MLSGRMRIFISVETKLNSNTMDGGEGKKSLAQDKGKT